MALDQNDLSQISTLLGQAATKAVQEATAPLLQKISALEAQQAQAPKPLTFDDVKTVIGDHLKGIPTREDLAAELAKVKAEGAAGKGEPAGNGQGADPSKAPFDVTTSPEFKALQERLEAGERERAQEREQAAQANRRRHLRDTIAKHGFQGRQEHVARYLEAESASDGEPLLRTDDKGNLCWAKEHLGSVRLFPLEDGLKEWASTPDAKTYLPPKGSEGTGDAPGGAAGGGKRTVSLSVIRNGGLVGKLLRGGQN